MHLEGGEQALGSKQRILQELRDLQQGTWNGKAPSVQADMVGADIHHWKGVIYGPEGTPYEGGTFHVDIELPPDYPLKPPLMKIVTRIWHPNVSSQTGIIGAKLLNEWTPALSIKAALMQAQALLSAPQLEHQKDFVAAQMYVNDVARFNARAKEWTENYAK